MQAVLIVGDSMLGNDRLEDQFHFVLCMRNSKSEIKNETLMRTNASMRYTGTL